MEKVGVQKAGSSSGPIYQKALELVRNYALPRDAQVADIGGGAGHFSRLLLNEFDRVTLVDYEPHVDIWGIDAVHANLNEPWPDLHRELDVIIALEVIEHLENPRHFIRNVISWLRPGGLAIISTPNQLSFASKTCFFLRGQHQHFQESCYPAHITPLLPVDFQRICGEVGAVAVRISFSDNGRIPGTRTSWQRAIPLLKGRRFSDNFFVQFQRSLK